MSSPPSWWLLASTCCGKSWPDRTRPPLARGPCRIRLVGTGDYGISDRPHRPSPPERGMGLFRVAIQFPLNVDVDGESQFAAFDRHIGGRSFGTHGVHGDGLGRIEALALRNCVDFVQLAAGKGGIE